MQTISRFNEILLSRYDAKIQFLAREYLEKEGRFVGIITAGDPLHLFFHDVDRAELKTLHGHIAHFLDQSVSRRIVLAGGDRPDVLTLGELHFKLEKAACHLRRHFPEAEVEALLVRRQENTVERVALLK